MKCSECEYWEDHWSAATVFRMCGKHNRVMHKEDSCEKGSEQLLYKYKEEVGEDMTDRPLSVPLLRTCAACGIMLPSTEFYTWQIERFSLTRLVRDGKCKHCREVEGTKKETIYDMMISYLERGGGDTGCDDIILI